MDSLLLSINNWTRPTVFFTLMTIIFKKFIHRPHVRKCCLYIMLNDCNYNTTKTKLILIDRAIYTEKQLVSIFTYRWHLNHRSSSKLVRHRGKCLFQIKLFILKKVTINFVRAFFCKSRYLTNNFGKILLETCFENSNVQSFLNRFQILESHFCLIYYEVFGTKVV